MERPEHNLYVNTAQNKIVALRQAYSNQFDFKPQLYQNDKYQVSSTFEQRQKEYVEKSKEKKLM
jgi:predicted phage tail protein